MTRFVLANILITGGAGYLGSVITPTLLMQGHQVTVIDNFMYRQSSLLDCCRYPNFEIVRGDCRDASLVLSKLRQCDVVIPLAAIVGMPLCEQDPTNAKLINEDAVRFIVDHLSAEQKIIFPMTNSGYGIGQEGVVCTEESPLKPISLYGVTKANAEACVLAHDNAITFRLATVFGLSPRMRLDLLVNDFVYRAVTDASVVVFEGHFIRNYIHIRDVAKAFVHALSNFDTLKGNAFNVGLEDANLSKIELCEVIKRQLPKFEYVEAQVGEDPDKRNYKVSNQKILSTGYRPDWRLEEGIEELIKGYRIVRNSLYANV